MLNFVLDIELTLDLLLELDSFSERSRLSKEQIRDFIMIRDLAREIRLENKSEAEVRQTVQKIRSDILAMDNIHQEFQSALHPLVVRAQQYLEVAVKHAN
ncbi:hypothetical protein [Leptolyngbya sp. 7M]|uniref:hypothetical protein n=1 Tax=Leptolyngbya sp. 7M TaxID=2812896 RepID=UPI001B8AC522|nr:hypothetical protein [Leptolyngbya sp. 7M]QYO65288.1 hypothetical protein JVX88_00440 [Leptolyngbya sp. 7M]